MSSPTPIQPPEHTNSQIPIHSDRSVGAPNYHLPKYAWPIALVVLAVGAFLIGQRLAPAPEPTVIENESPVTDASGLPLPDGKGGGEEAVDVEPQPVPADLASFSYPKEIPFHADLAAQLKDAYAGSGEALEAMTGFDLGLVTVGGKSYQLQMHESKVASLGTMHTVYYVLASDTEAYDYLLADRISTNSFGGPGTFGTSSDFGPVISEGATRLRFKSGVRLPQLERRDMTDTSGGIYRSMGLSRLYTAEEITWLAASSDCTRRTAAFPLCLLLPREQRQPEPAEYPAAVDGTSWRLRPDARVEWYVADIPFRTSGDEKPSETFIPAVTWNDGGPKDLSYIQGHIGGCGVGTAVDIVDPAAVGKLKEVGTYVVDGKRGTVSVAPISTEDWMYTFWKESHFDGTPEQFAATRPYFYWTDQFGRLLKFTSTDAVPPVECGKPVIYLYPEQTTDVSVKVAPQGGFTYTDPEYGTGWEVVAKPDGALTNKADGKGYPYLFWEGRGGLYQSPEKYWVVAKADVPSFITSTLTRLGLNEKEIADFNEFWLPRMEAAPYYKVGFHGTRVMDQLAPLDISPRPDSVFRVLMDYEELSAPIPANPPALPRAFVRDGFTVVEWGGVLR